MISQERCSSCTTTLSTRYVELESRRYVEVPHSRHITIQALPKAKAAAINALRLDGPLGEAHNSLAFCLGRNDEAIVEMRKAENLDPLSLIINADLAELLIAHSYDESIRQSQRTDRNGS